MLKVRLRGRPTGAAAPVLLGALAYALAFAQRPGLATADTKINLHVDPVRFLGDVASMWTSTGQLGDVQAGQQAGYLFPMGPFFAAGHALGVSDWVVQRLWLGTLLALAAWGVVALLDALRGRRDAVAALTAGAVTLANPFVVTYVNRTTVTLLAYAALPWLMVAVHRGLRDARGWRWPAAFALLVTASGGGVNGAVTAWMLLGPVLLALWEPLRGEVAWVDVRALALRTIGLTALVSLWWVIPAYVQSSYGIDFLKFTEQPGTVWGTTSSTESLRLMSFWLSYVGVGFAGRAIPYFDDSRTLLFSSPVVLASLLLPAATLTGFVWTRRWRYGPFLLGLAIVAVLVMGAGFPEGTPLRHGLHFAYDHVASVRFLRASYKAAPLLAIALACLAGAAATELWRRFPRLALHWACAVAGLAVLVGASWPLVSGHAQDAQVSFKRVPAAWRAAAGDLNRQLPANSRAIVLPGDLFSFYTWGGTVDPILPALSRRPVAERSEVPYSDLRATDLLWTIDSLVHQQRLLPGQLAPLLGLIGVRAVVTGTDDDLARSDAPAPADAAAQLSAQTGFAHPARVYGPERSFLGTSVGPAVRLAQVRRYDLPAGRGMVRVEPRADPVVVDGSADALAGLAAFGALPAHDPLMYSADLAPARLRAVLSGGGSMVISDSNRRAAFVAGSLEQNIGPTLTPQQNVSSDGMILDPFTCGPDCETVARYGGIRSVEAPASPQLPQFPEHAPFAALDGSSATAWLADPTLGPAQRWLQVDFTHPRDVPYVVLDPYDDAGGSVLRVQIGARSFVVHPGPNRLAAGLRDETSLRVTLTDVSAPRAGYPAGAGGIRELRIPGVRAREALRLPVDGARALTGVDLDRVSLSYLFSRVTGDDPYQRDLDHGPFSSFDVHQPGDGEQTMQRVFDLPAARRFSASAWVAPFATTPDDILDRLAGFRGSVRFTSSSRFDSEPRWRASSAFDGDPGTAWIGDWPGPGSSQASLTVRSRRTLRVARLRLRAPALRVRRPTQVQLRWTGGATGALDVSPSGVVTLPHPIASRSLTLLVLAASVPSGASAADARAVGIASLDGIQGLVRPRARRSRTFSAPCGSVRVRVGDAVLSLRVSGSASAFGDGTPLRAQSCGAPMAVAAGMQRLSVQPGPLAVDELRLASPAPQPAAPVSETGRVVHSGTSAHGSYRHVVVAVHGPSWLVLGEGYDRGWRASCNGRSLGAPTPIDGYANGWAVGPGCRDVSFTFAPDQLARDGYIASGVGGLACVLLLLVGGWRARRRRRAGSPTSSAPAQRSSSTDAPARRSTPIGALAWSLPAAAVFAFMFGLEPGALAVPVLAFVLWRGVGARALTLTAGALLAAVVPVLYLAHPGDERGGNHFGYAASHLAAHYVGVAALGLLALALWRTLHGPTAQSPRPSQRRRRPRLRRPAGR